MKVFEAETEGNDRTAYNYVYPVRVRERKQHDRNVIFVCNSNRKSGGYDFSCDPYTQRSGSDRSGGYKKQYQAVKSFEIQTPMTSYHEYNKYEKGRKLVEKLLEGQNIALITDAGTPGISDPGEELVKMCYESGIPVTSLPGAAACITALTISGLSTRRFAFEAFLPSDKKEREQILKEMETETRTMIVYEAPHRLVKTLKLFLERLGNRKITVCRELTKRHETALAVTLEEAVAHYEANPPKGNVFW